MGRVNLSWKERIHLWWLRGYDAPELVDRYLSSLERKGKTLGRKRGSLERSEETLEQDTEILDPSLEQQNVKEEARGKPLEIPSRDHVQVSKEELEALKKALGIEKGCLQYKRKGDSVYLVTYNPEKKGYDWKRLGTLTDLKHEAELKEKAVISQSVP